MKIDKTSPLYPLEYEQADLVSWQAFERGQADADQQKRCLEWLFKATGLNDLSYRPDSDRDSAFAEGKRFVGLQVRKMLIVNPRVFNIPTGVKQ